MPEVFITLRKAANSQRNSAGEGDFCRLPEELILHVVSCLDLSDLVRVCLLSKRWREFANNESIWQHLFQVTFGRMNDNQSNWKQIFKEHYLFSGKWHTHSQDMVVSEDGRTIRNTSFHWLSGKVGKSSIPEHGIHEWQFEVPVLADAMVSIAEDNWQFLSFDYPGTGWFGITKFQYKNYPGGLKKDNNLTMSIAYYEQFRPGDQITVIVDANKKEVSFLKNNLVPVVRSTHESALPPEESVSYRDHVQPMVILCALCGSNSEMTILSYKMV